MKVSVWNETTTKWISLDTSCKHLYMYCSKLFGMVVSYLLFFLHRLCTVGGQKIMNGQATRISFVVNQAAETVQLTFKKLEIKACT